ncbi:MAG: EAL domain-containing protein [Candidatus Eremiobacteraeota bacterium]|nr:EAL domain-containing protein [Candidatus Eremiobacteraeota bacterium]
MIGERALEQLDEILSRSPLALVAMSRDFRVSYWSKRAAELYGFSREKMLGRHPLEMPWIHPEDLASVLQSADQIQNDPMLVLVSRATRADGELRTFRWTAVAVQDDDRFWLIAFGEDITETVAAQEAVARKEEQLERSEARLRSLFAHNPDPVLALDLDGTMIDCNDAAVRISGIARENIVGHHFATYLPRAARPKAEKAFARAAQGKAASVTVAIVNADGRPIEVDATIFPQYSGDAVVGIYAIFQDTTERRSAERQALMQQQRMRDLYFIAASGRHPESRIRASLEMGVRAFELAAGAVVENRAEPAIVEVFRNPSVASVSDERLIAAARPAFGQPAGTAVASLHGVATPFAVAGSPYGVLVFVSQRGAPKPLSETDADLLGLMSTLIGGAIESDRSRAQLRTLAYYDTLTGLPNRAYITEKVRDAIEVAQTRLSRAALLSLDLDGFKDVNDTLGHARGDRLLQLVASRMKEVVGDRGRVARMGGDEFVVLLPECASAEEARELAERLIGAVGEPFALDDYEHFTSASVGIALYPDDARDDETLIKNADIALSRAKDRGRNSLFFYNPTLEAPIHLRLSQEKLLRRALDLHEFVVFFQPQLDVRTDRIVSVEALVRWNHPKTGLITPAHFIPSAEISGLIVPLGDWVLATAARQVRQWHPQLGPLRLAVNLSARQFHDRRLRHRVTEALDQADFPADLFEVEITESVAMADAAQTADIVRDLSDSGIRVTLDDFGTGYSSLAYLRSFDIDVLKIDGSFVRGIGRSTGDETIVNTVIGMAHSLDLEVIAEGVETREQLAFLIARGCDAIQGHVLAPAMPAEEFESFVAARTQRSSA